MILRLLSSPVRAGVWLLEQIAEEAERQRTDPVALAAAIDELDAALDADEITPEEHAEREVELLAALGLAGGGPDDQPDDDGGRRRG